MTGDRRNVTAVRRRRTPAQRTGTKGDASGRRPVRRDHHRHRGRRGDAGAPAGLDRQAHPSARARRLAAPRARQLGSTAVFVEGRYRAPEFWYDGHGQEFPPEVNYYVGGNTKFYGAALFRLRPEDFGELRHHGGISPAWPIGYDDLEPYYSQAEHLYRVHGRHGEDPTEGPIVPFGKYSVQSRPLVCTYSEVM